MINFHPVQYEHEPKNHLFETTFRFYIDCYEDPDPVKEFVTWCYTSFDDNFILLESCHYRLAGGYVDNKMGLRDINASFKRKKEDRMVNYYELRCSKKDAVLLLLKYNKEEQIC